jgi:hypothetical protein
MTSSDKLEEIANFFGQRTKRSNVLGTGLTFQLNDHRGHKIKFYSTTQTIKVDIKINSLIAISFHQPDSICLINQPLTLQYPTRVFTGSIGNKEQVIEFANKVKPIIEGLDLKNSESIVIYKNQILAEVYPDRDFKETIDRLLELISLNSTTNEE